MQFLKDNFQFLVIVGLLVFFLFFRGGQTPSNAPTIVIQADTSWKVLIPLLTQHTAGGQIVNTIPYPVTKIEKEYIPNPNYDILKAQYEDLRGKYLATNIQKDTLRVDTIGYVALTDSIQRNMNIGREYTYNLKYPTITITKIITNPPKRSFYYGFELQSGLDKTVNEFDVGLLYKDKKEQIFGTKLGYSPQMGPQVGVKYYRKF